MTGEGVDNLLELILLGSRTAGAKAPTGQKGLVIVVDAYEPGGFGDDTHRSSGTLREGDNIACRSIYGRVRAIIDDRGRSIKEASNHPCPLRFGPPTCQAGELFYVSEDERQAKDIAVKRQQQLKNRRLQMTSRVTREPLYAQVQDGHQGAQCHYKSRRPGVSGGVERFTGKNSQR